MEKRPLKGAVNPTDEAWSGKSWTHQIKEEGRDPVPSIEALHVRHVALFLFTLK